MKEKIINVSDYNDLYEVNKTLKKKIIEIIENDHEINKVITNCQTGACIQDILMYDDNSKHYTSIELQPVEEAYKFLTYKKKIDFYVDPHIDWNKNEILFKKDNGEVVKIKIKTTIPLL